MSYKFRMQNSELKSRSFAAQIFRICPEQSEGSAAIGRGPDPYRDPGQASWADPRPGQAGKQCLRLGLPLRHLRYLALALLISPFTIHHSPFLYAQAAKTTVTDTIFNADGSKPNGTITATNPNTFVSADGFTITAGSRITAPIAAGVFTIQLVPNAGSNPAGTSYAVNYYTPGLTLSETWIVPSSVPPVNLAAVRVLTPPLPTVMLGIQQINPPSPCTANFFAQWSGIQWQCAAGGGGGGATFQVNGTNTTSQTTINWQSGTNVAVSNPSAGNVAFNFTGTLPIGSGGTGQTTAGAAFNALSPMTTLGDVIYGGTAGAGTRLAGNTTATKQYFTQTGTGSVSAAPAWAQGAFADLSGTASDSQLASAYSGVGACAASKWSSTLTRNAAPTCTQPGFGDLTGSIALGQTPLTTRGDLLTVNLTPALIRLGLGTNGQCLTSNGLDALWGACAAGSGVTLQTNGTNNASQTTLNLQNSAATNGFTLTHTNVSAGNVQLGLSGTLTVPGGGTGLGTLTAHDLYVGNGTANPNPVATGSSGQVLISNGASADPTFQDPIVSSAYVNLFNATSATATQTSSSVRVPTFSGYGTLYVTYAAITGSPAGCTLQLKNADSLGNLINNGAAISTTPANGTTTSAVSSGAGLQTEAQIQAVYACTTFPTAGTFSLDYVPGVSVGLVGSLPTGTNTIGAVTQASGPWTVSQSGTWTVQPGNIANTTAWLVTGTGGTFPATQSGTWTVQPGNTQNTTPWLTQDGANGTVVSGAAAGKSELIGCQFNTTLPTLTTGQQAAAQCDSSARLLVGSIAGALPTGSNVIGAVTQSGAFNVNQTIGVAGFEKVTDGTNTAAVKAASTAAVAADPSFVVGLSPNSPLPTGSNTIGTVTANQGTANTIANAWPIAGNASGSPKVPAVCDNWKPFSFASTTAQLLVTGTAAKQTYICSINIVVGAATNVALIEGTTTTNPCDTGTAGMAGGSTAATGWNFAANGGLTMGSGIGAPFRTATAADNVCFLASAANQVSGSISWTQL
jgi:hypothetical protein